MRLLSSCSPLASKTDLFLNDRRLAKLFYFKVWLLFFFFLQYGKGNIFSILELARHKTRAVH